MVNLCQTPNVMQATSVNEYEMQEKFIRKLFVDAFRDNSPCLPRVKSREERSICIELRSSRRIGLLESEDACTSEDPWFRYF